MNFYSRYLTIKSLVVTMFDTRNMGLKLYKIWVQKPETGFITATTSMLQHLVIVNNHGHVFGHIKQPQSISEILYVLYWSSEFYIITQIAPNSKLRIPWSALSYFHNLFDDDIAAGYLFFVWLWAKNDQKFPIFTI